MDSHVHTILSHDGKSSILDYINNNNGINEITFTEHYDIYDGINSNLKTIDLDNYYKEYLKYKDNKKVKINFGIEVGLQPDLVNEINTMLDSYPFDFVIGSSHITCKKDMAMDKSFFEGLTRFDAYLNYFKEVLENIKLYDNFDVYGHLDYVVRYGNYDEKIINYNEFKDILDEILLLLINKNKGLEVNTSGFRYSLGYFHPNMEILLRYKELGGYIITLGSDAHHVNDLAFKFNQTLEILDNIGFSDIAVYHNRKPEFVKINKLR